MRSLFVRWVATPMAVGAAMLLSSLAHADLLLFSGPDGLSAEADVTLVDATTVEIKLRNTSTGVPVGFTAANQLLTGFSWDAGAVGINGTDPSITGGTCVTGPSSFSVNFSITDVGAGANIGGEWGWSNIDGSGLLPNFISGNTSSATAFGGPNLDGPVGLDGPQAGLWSASHPLALGGVGAIEDQLIATITLNMAIDSLDELFANGARIEYGSSGYFVELPAPGAATILLAGLLGVSRRRRAA